MKNRKELDMDIKIQPADTDRRIRFVARFFEETIALWEKYEVTPESVAERVEQVREWVTKENSHITVAVTDEGDIVGFNSLFISKGYDGEPFGKIVILFVLPEFRRKGIAAQLKQEGEDWLRAQGVTKVITEIDAKNERMLEINRKVGFRVKSYTLEREI